MIKIPILKINKMRIIKTMITVQIIEIRIKMTTIVVEGVLINTIPHKLNKLLKLINMIQFKLRKQFKLALHRWLHKLIRRLHRFKVHIRKTIRKYSKKCVKQKKLKKR